jgi:hypothetical protein
LLEQGLRSIIVTLLAYNRLRNRHPVGLQQIARCCSWHFHYLKLQRSITEETKAWCSLVIQFGAYPLRPSFCVVPYSCSHWEAWLKDWQWEMKYGAFMHIGPSIISDASLAGHSSFFYFAVGVSILSVQRVTSWMSFVSYWETCLTTQTLKPWKILGFIRFIGK